MLSAGRNQGRGRSLARAMGRKSSSNVKSLAGLFSGLVLSGVAGIVNQVVWQRALKIFLGGSEALSAMIVVLVFMLGLASVLLRQAEWPQDCAIPCVR